MCFFSHAIRNIQVDITIPKLFQASRRRARSRPPRPSPWRLELPGTTSITSGSPGRPFALQAATGGSADMKLGLCSLSINSSHIMNKIIQILQDLSAPEEEQEGRGVRHGVTSRAPSRWPPYCSIPKKKNNKTRAGGEDAQNRVQGKGGLALSHGF